MPKDISICLNIHVYIVTLCTLSLISKKISSLLKVKERNVAKCFWHYFISLSSNGKAHWNLILAKVQKMDSFRLNATTCECLSKSPWFFLYLYRPSPHCLQSIIYPQLPELRLISSSTLVYSQAMVMFSLHTNNSYSVINLCLNGLDLLLFLIVKESIKLTRMICNTAYIFDDMY